MRCLHTSRPGAWWMLLLLSLPSMGRATELDAWKPGAASGQLQDPLSAHSPWALEAGGTGLGIWAHALKAPLYGADLPADGSVASPPVEALTWFGPTGLQAMWRPASGAPFDLGGRARFRYMAQNPGAVDAVLASGGMTDAAGWLRFTPAPILERQVAVTVEATVDPDTLGTVPDPRDIAWMTGAGTGVGATLSVGSAPNETGLHRWSAIGVGTDLRSPESLAGAGELSPSQSLDLQGGLSWVQPTHAWLAELHARGGRLAAGDPSAPGPGYGETPMLSSSLEGRVGVRMALSDLWRSAVVVGAGVPVRTASGDRIQPTGSPAVRLGVDVQRVGKPKPPPPPPAAAGAGELVVIPVNQAGERITFLELPGMEYRVGPESERIAVYTPGTPVTVDAAEYASLTMVPQTYGPGPWVWSPVLVPRQGNARVRLNLADMAGQGVETSSFVVGGMELGQIAADTVVVVEGFAPGAIQVAADGPLIQATQAELTASDDDTDESVNAVVVGRPVGAVRVWATSAGTPIVGARWKAWDGTQEESGMTDARGMARLVLPVGLWQVRIDAEGFGGQEQTLRVKSDDAHLQTVPFTLLPKRDDASEVLELTVFDGDGERVSDAVVVLGDSHLGQTVSGGRLRVEGLTADEAPLTVGGTLLRDSAGLPVRWGGDDTTRVEVPVAWKAGVVELEVRNLEGEPIDGVVARLVEPDGTVLDPMPLGPDGYLQTRIPPGKYQLTLAARGYGLHTYDIDVPPDLEDRLLFDVVLAPPASVGTRLIVRIIDSDGADVPDSRVTIDGQARTSAPTTGPWVISDLSEGEHDLEVEADSYEPWSGRVSLIPGTAVEQEVPLRMVSGIVRLQATHGEQALNATVRMARSSGIEGPVTLGSNGRRAIAVESGRWETTFAASGYDTEAFDVEVSSRKPVQVQWEAKPDASRFHLEAPGPRAVHVRLVDAETGATLAGRVRVIGPAVVLPDAVGTETATTFALETGNWELFAEVPGRGVTGHKVAVGLSDAPFTVDIPIGESLVEVTEEAIQIAEKVHFATGRASIESSSDSLLDAVASTLRFRSDIRLVVVEGHTDNVGAPERNQALSEERAAAVRTALVERGVAPDRLVVEAYGESRPIASNDTREGREMNRRVVFRIVDKSDSTESPEAEPPTPQP